ncbi:MAG: hypothetical protein JXN65_04185 [Clostridia bacterium]|nr:hypothetical protein [Clostridia bacterium]
MRIITSDANWKTSPIVELKDEEGNFILAFEDMSSVLGTKICARNEQSQTVFFMDESVDKTYEAIEIQKGGSTVALVKNSTGIMRSEITVETAGNKYSYYAMQTMLQFGEEKAAKLIRKAEKGAFKIELYREEDTELIIAIMYAIEVLSQ